MGVLGKVQVGRKFHREYILCVMAPSRGGIWHRIGREKRLEGPVHRA